MADKKWPYPEAEAVLPRSDFVGWISSTDLPQWDGRPGISVCNWLIRSLDGETEYRSPTKRSRKDHSDEKRALVAALVGVLESLSRYSWIVLYAPGSYVRDGLKYSEFWRNSGWKNKRRKVVPNRDAWARVLELIEKRAIKIVIRPWPKSQHKSIRKDLMGQVRRARS